MKARIHEVRAALEDRKAWQVGEKDLANRVLKNAQMQGSRNSEE